VWGAQDFVNGNLPLSLDGVRVAINGKPAAVESISPTQINVLAPNDTAAPGPVNVVVNNSNGTSAPFSTQLQAYSPAFFTFSPPNQRYITGVFPPGPEGSSDYLAPSGALGSNTSSRPAKAGDIVELYATGFGRTSPEPPEGQTFFGAYPTSTAITVTIGGLNATVVWAGLTSVGLYQLNIIVPSGLPDGDVPVVATVGGVKTQSATFIPAQ
jgi:uncharacterized protein (TIGR03437 family)